MPRVTTVGSCPGHLPLHPRGNLSTGTVTCEWKGGRGHDNTITKTEIGVNVQPTTLCSFSSGNKIILFDTNKEATLFAVLEESHSTDQRVVRICSEDEDETILSFDPKYFLPSDVRFGAQSDSVLLVCDETRTLIWKSTVETAGNGHTVRTASIFVSRVDDIPPAVDCDNASNVPVCTGNGPGLKPSIRAEVNHLSPSLPLSIHVTRSHERGAKQSRREDHEITGVNIAYQFIGVLLKYLFRIAGRLFYHILTANSPL